MRRAGVVWDLVARQSTPGWVALVHEPGSWSPVACWPLSQVIHAAAMLQPGMVRALFRGARAYRSGHGYRESPLRGRRYYDDNAWLALASLQHYRATGNLRSLSRAQGIARFLGGGLTPSGYRWVEGGETINACSTGAAALVVCELGGDPAPAIRALLRMRRGDGVIGDHLRADGSLDTTAFTYNHGLFIGLLARAGDRRMLGEAIDAGAAYFTPERLWEQPVCFNAVYARELARAGAPMRGVAQYVERLWAAGRDAGGWFTGAGRYGSGVVLDTAAAAQLLAVVDGFDPMRLV